MRRRRLVLAVMVVAGSVCLAAQGAGAQQGTVRGVVRYASGEPIADVRVTLMVARTGTVVLTPEAREALNTRTGVDGSYRFDAIPPGEYQVSASHAGAVARQVQVTAAAVSIDTNFSIPDGSSRRVVTARVVMNAASADRQVPARIGIGVRQDDGTLVIPLAPGDQRLVVRLPSGYFLDSATYGSARVYSLEQVGGRRLPSAPFSITVPPEPQSIPELVITLGAFR